MPRWHKAGEVLDLSEAGTELDRPAAQQERAIVGWLLQQAEPRFQPLAAQIDSLQVVWRCNCGCPSVSFAVTASDSDKPYGLISDQLATVNVRLVGVMLFVKHEQLSMLEVYSFDGDENPLELPNLEDLFRWEELSHRTGLSINRPAGSPQS